MFLSFEGDRKDAMAPGRLGLARDTVHTCRERASNGQSLGGGLKVFEPRLKSHIGKSM